MDLLAISLRFQQEFSIVGSEPFFLGLTLAEFEDISLKVLCTGLILYMLFIIGNLAKQSKAGKYGTIWLFVALGLGFTGFIAKSVITYFMEH